MVKCPYFPSDMLDIVVFTDTNLRKDQMWPILQ